jgi:bacterioferritin
MDKQTLIAHLNEDLANEYAAIIQYIDYAAKTTGPFRPELSKFFLAEVVDEQGHAQFLSNKIVALGGEPVTVAAKIKNTRTNREMLDAVLEAERKAVNGYTQRAKEAEEFGDKGLSVQLENMIQEETGHFEEVQRILRDWSVV